MPRPKYEHPGGLFDHPTQLLTLTGFLLALGWIGFVGSVHLHEMIVGVAVVALSTAFCRLIFSAETLPLALHLRDVLQVWRVPLDIAKDTLLVTRVLFADLFTGRRAGSFYRACGFRTSLRDPVLVGRSALATMYATMSPNMIVIGIDAARSQMLFHQIARDDLSELTRSLGAQQ